jgi:hypothetical protein
LNLVDVFTAHQSSRAQQHEREAKLHGRDSTLHFFWHAGFQLAELTKTCFASKQPALQISV